MKKLTYSVLFIAAVAIAIAGCSKSKNNITTTDQTTLEGQVLTDFSNDLVNPNYQDIQLKASIMNDAVTTFVASSTDQNLAAVQLSWRNTRAAWESCEGFLFGPVEDDSYDPDMDDWPVDKTRLDSLLASSNALTVGDITPLETTLKGFHAIEYIIFGVGSTRKAADINPRDKEYLVSLTQSLYNTTTALRNSWDPAAGNYTAQVINAGKGSATYNSRQAVFIALVGSMADICNEVANEKMQTPFVAKDSTLSESSFSHNSINDFTHNIAGIKNAYLSSYTTSTGNHSLSELVAAKNASLNNTLLSQMDAAVASFSAFASLNVTFEKAIYTQRSTVQQVQKTINTLETTLHDQLLPFVTTNIKD
jgi:putative iron-regulated protein